MALAESGIRRKYGVTAAVLVVIASLVPNADYLMWILSPDSYIFGHRTVTHSLIGAFLLASLASFLFWMFSPLKRVGLLFALALLGVASHLFLDSFNAWGIAFLYPFSPARFSLDWIALSAVWVWVLLVAGVGAGYAFPAERERINRSLLVLLFCCFLVCGGLRALAREQFRVGLLSMGTRYDAMEAYPQFSNPFLWNVVAVSQGRYFQAFVHSFAGVRGRVRMFFETPVPAELASSFVETYRSWAGVPLVRFAAGGPPPEVVICDLRFFSSRGTISYAAKLEVVPPGVPHYRWLESDDLVLAADAEFELPRVRPNAKRL